MATITALSWAVLAIGLKLALKTFSSGTIVWFRMSIAVAILLAFALVWRRQWLKILLPPPWLAILSGVFITFNYYGFMKAVELTTASNAQIMIQFAPLGFAAASIFVFKEVPTPIQLLGMLTAVVGFGFFYWDQILVSVDQVDSFQTGNLWVLFAAATWIGFALLQKALLKKYPPQAFNLLIYLVATVLLFPLADMGEWQGVGAFEILLVVFLGINTVVAYGALSEALIRIPASQVSMIISLNPLLTIFIMTILTQMEVEWIKGEPIHWRGFTGALLVVTGVILTVTRPTRLSRRRTVPTI